MQYLPISGIFFRHLWVIRNQLNRMLFIFYWPLLDILLWGFVGKYMQSFQTNNNIEMIFLLATLLWASFARIGMEMFVCLLEELWSYNIINIFASPITLTEWIVGSLVFIGTLFVTLISFLMVVIKLFYAVPFLVLLKNFLIFAPSLLFSGICVSFLALSIVIYFGMRVNEVAFVIMWSFMPFTGIYYPIESLPAWAQKISAFLPMSYVFSGMRVYIAHNTNPAGYLLKSFGLSCAYGTAFLLLFFYMFHKSKDLGLSRLTD